MSEPVSVLNRATASDGQTITIADRGLVGQVTLRGDLSSKALKAALKSAVGVDVPGPLRAVFEGSKGAVWMSPDELLLLTEYDQADGQESFAALFLAKEIAAKMKCPGKAACR
jgi:sarcosine oxidase subunit gamma